MPLEDFKYVRGSTGDAEQPRAQQANENQGVDTFTSQFSSQAERI